MPLTTNTWPLQHVFMSRSSALWQYAVCVCVHNAPVSMVSPQLLQVHFQQNNFALVLVLGEAL